MAFGCLLTLIGYHFGNIDNNSVDAQVEVEHVAEEKAEIVDEIRCRRLVIVGDDDTQPIILDKDSLDRGMIKIYNEDGARRMFLGLFKDYDGGLIEVTGKESGGLASMLGADSNGGFIALFNKLLDKPIVEAAITQKGHGSIVIRDKDWDQLGVMGPLGIFTTKAKTRK